MTKKTDIRGERHRAANAAQRVLVAAEMAHLKRLDEERNESHARILAREEQAAQVLEEARLANIKMGLDGQRIPMICNDIIVIKKSQEAETAAIEVIQVEAARKTVILTELSTNFGWVRLLGAFFVAVVMTGFGVLWQLQITTGNQVAGVAASLEDLKK